MIMIDTTIDEPSELEQLVAEYQDGTATTEQVTQLDRAVATSPAAALLLRDAMRQDVLLTRMFQQDDAIALLTEAVSIHSDAPEENVSQSVAPLAAPGRLLSVAWFGFRDTMSTTAAVSAILSGLFITIVLLVMALLTMPEILRPDRPEGPGSVAVPKIVAQVTGSFDAEWSESSIAELEGEVFIFERQLLELNSGVVELKYDNGVLLTIQAPAVFEVTDADSLSLSSGRATASVPPPARGFAMHLPGVKLIDWGTEFGVRVGDDQAGELHVFKGEVEAQIRPGTAAVASYRVTGGNSLTWNPEARQLAESKAEASDFTMRLPRAISVRLPSTGNSWESDLLAIGELDPRWQVKLASSPEQANAAKVVSIASYSKSRTGRSNWISLPEDWHGSAGNQDFLFSVRFEVRGVNLETMRAVARFSADNQVTTVRLNGHELQLPEQGSEEHQRDSMLQIGPHFIEGENLLEVEVRNLTLNPNPMALRWEWFGQAMPAVEQSNTDTIEHD